MNTLRARLLFFTSAATASVLIAAALAVYLVARESLYNQFDSALLAASQAIESATELHSKGVRLDMDPAQFPEYARKASPDFFQVWLEPDTVLAKSQSLIVSNAQLALPPSAPLTPIIIEATLPDGELGRMVYFRFSPHVENEQKARPPQKPVSATLVVARHIRPLEAELSSLRLLLFAVGVFATAFTALTLLWAVKSGLRPLRALASQIEAVGQSDLLNPIELPNTPGELSIVVRRLNELLARLHDAIVRERAFTADVSHELRTPLAGLEVTLEIASLKQRTPQDYEGRIHKSLSIVRELRSMVDNLLTLARADAGQLAVNSSELDLSHFVESCWVNFQDAVDDRGLTTSLDLQPLAIRTDADKLRIILQNLMDNALTYCDPEGHISIALTRSDDAVVLTISNTARSITPEQAAQVFDRFWRADPSRSDTGVHCGLGLSLSQKIAPLLGATLDVQVSHDQVFHARLRLLKAETTPPATKPSIAIATAST